MTLSEDKRDWQPACDIDALHARARLLARTRAFFMARQVIEVETPTLGRAGAMDPSLHNITVSATASAGLQTRYLQTSPEFFMKRLLAAGAGSIYQICKAFRDGEAGTLHNPEFTILEWYRPDFDHHQLMDEVHELIVEILGPGAIERLSYAELFWSCLEIDIDNAEIRELRAAVDQETQAGFGERLDRDECLDLLVTSVVSRALREKRTFVYDYPASQAALARVRPGPPERAERFELFINGVELANGFHELCDAKEQRRRFEAERARRVALRLPVSRLDEQLLEALEYGLPNCAGVAIGVDRLLMLSLNRTRLSDVVAFPCE